MTEQYNNKLSVPYNFDETLIDICGMMGVNDIYFPIHPSYCPTARGCDFTDVDAYDKNLQEICKKMRGYGIKPVMLMNGNVSPLIELRNREKIFELISKLDLSGVTMNNIFMIPLVHDEFPDLTIRASVLMETEDEHQVAQLHDMGVNEVCLRMDLIRQMSKLHRIREFNPDVKLSLIVNQGCQNYCSFYKYHHYVGSAMSIKELTRADIDATNRFIHPPKVDNNLYRAPWVAPEHLKHYDFIDIFKLVDRKFPTYKIIDIVQSYAQGKTLTPYFNDLLGLYCNVDNKNKIPVPFPEDFQAHVGDCGHRCEECTYCEDLRLKDEQFFSTI